jgi:autotransporter-associated beta strand protein
MNDWSVGTNWNPQSAPNAVGASASFISTTPNSAANIATADGAITVGSILFDLTGSLGNNDFRINNNSGGTGSLILDNGGSGATITTQGTGIPNNDIAAPMQLDDNVTLNVNQTTNQSSAGSLNITAEVTGSGGITKNGPGVLTFGSNDKLYTGATVLNAGRTRISVAAHPSATSSFTINSGAQVELISDGTYTFGTGPLNLNGFGLGPASHPGYFPGTIRPETSNVSTITNNVVLQSNAGINLHGAATSLTLSGVISGTGLFELGTLPGDPANQGTLFLQSANTYSGGTLVSQGTIDLSGSATLGTGNVTIDGVSAGPGGSVAAGKVTIHTGVTNAISDAATLSLTGGAIANGGRITLDAGVNETVGGLVLGGAAQTQAGTYGSTSSSATFQNDLYFVGAGVITLVPGADNPGDHNEDGIVDAADYVLWRKDPANNGGTPGGYQDWRANFGETGPGAGGGNGGAVPEPSTLVLLGLIAPVVLAARRTRHIK